MKKLSKTDVPSITRRLLAMKFFSEFLLIYALFTVMFSQRGHVPISSISIIIAMGFIFSIVFEIPTGIFADKIARKYVLMLSITAKILGLVTWLFFANFWGYLVGTAFFSLGTSLESGALQAYLYGTLGTESKKSFGKFWARMTAMVMVSYTLAYLCAAAVGVNYPVLLILSIVPCIVALILCASLPKDTLTSDVSVKPKIFASALAHIAKSPDLIRLVAGSILIIALGDMMIEYMSLYYSQIGVPTRFIPLVFIPGNILSAVLFWTLHSWEKSLNKYKVLVLILFSLLLISAFNARIGFAVAAFLLFSRVIRVLQIQFESNIQHLASDEARATITSIGAFISKLITAAAVLAVGFSAHGGSIIRPYRTALLAGVAIFILIQLVFRFRDSRATDRI